MPVHNFVCDKCMILVQDADTKSIHKCPECGGDMRWDLNISIHGNYRTPIHSDSLAISPDQIAEHRQKFPNIELDKQCRPVFNQFREHQKYLDDCNIVKERQKLKSKGVRIA